MGWLEYGLAFVAFFVSHALPVRPPLRPWLVARLGRAGFGLAYSALSLAVLAWLIVAAGRAPFVPLWTWAPWQNQLVLVVMLPVCLLLALSIGRPNPWSIGGWRNDRFDPVRPGVVRWVRHPLLMALGLWAAAHVVPNGDLAHVILFGSFTVFSLLGARRIGLRRAVEIGQNPHRRNTDAIPTGNRNLVLLDLVARLALGAVVYTGLILLHPSLIGVSPLP
jgi:uncharacterized membrane protein